MRFLVKILANSLLAMTTIKEVDAALSRYYTALNQPYDNQFETYCDDNGVEVYILSEELGTDGEVLPDESLLVDFDDNFPFHSTPSNTTKQIHSILKYCYQYPQCQFLFEVKELSATEGAYCSCNSPKSTLLPYC